MNRQELKLAALREANVAVSSARGYSSLQQIGGASRGDAGEVLAVAKKMHEWLVEELAAPPAGPMGNHGTIC